MDNSIETQVALHDQSIETLASSMNDLAKATSGNSRKLDALMVSMSKQEVILEKITHIEDTVSSNSNSIHKRIDRIDARLDVYDIERSHGGCAALESLSKEIEHNKDDIAISKNTRIWLSRVVGGSIILAILGFIYKGGLALKGG